MIYITEIKPRKISGRTSFLASFKFNQAAIDILKGLPTSYYHRKDQTWEFPADSLAQVLDSLTFVDAIQLTLMPDEPAIAKLSPLTQEEINSFKVKPFDHQIEAINFGLASSGKWLLLDSMGLGKTNEIIWYAETLKRRGYIDHCMIICGVDSLRQNWKNEIRKFSNYDCLVLGEYVTRNNTVRYKTIPERAKILKEPISEFFVIINAATIRSDDIIDAFSKSKNTFGMIAVDECHKFATKTSQQGSNLLKLKSDFKVAATGTLITNSPLSAYVPLAWTENDAATLTTYKSQYCVFGGFGGHEIVGYKNLESLKDEINSCMIRRTLDQVRNSMPAKTVDVELVEMPDDHRKFYEAIVAGVKEEADKVKLNANNLLALTTRLRQATACPSILTTQDVESCKLERAVEIAEELLEQGEKVVIMSTFKEPVYRLAKMLDQYKPLLGTGDLPDQTVQDNVAKFQNDPISKLLICTHSKCGTGLTMNAASYMICIDTPWTDAQFSQSTDRIWRVTNTRPAFVTVLACAGTIDERVWEIVNNKKDLSDYVVDGIENTVSGKFTDELAQIIAGL